MSCGGNKFGHSRDGEVSALGFDERPVRPRHHSRKSFEVSVHGLTVGIPVATRQYAEAFMAGRQFASKSRKSYDSYYEMW
jgi:hypothetical protein